MRLAFCVDGYQSQAGVVLTQDSNGVHGRVVAGDRIHRDAAGVISRQVARVLSLDYDGDEFGAVGHRDPVIGRLQAVAPGLRPPLFYSPYEAAVWGIMASRRPARQVAEVRRRLSETHGTIFDLDGHRVAALPTPEQMLAVASFPGIPDFKMQRLHGAARAALEGRLDATALLGEGPTAALRSMQKLDGIGPFYANLIVIRGTGFADVLPTDEPRLGALVAQLYGLDGPPEAATLARIAEPWRPFRTWAAVLIRAATARLDQPGQVPA